MDPNIGPDPGNSYADAPEESNGDNIEVICINETVGLTGNTDAYEETGTNVSDELIANGTPADNAIAVEIMATTATGATNAQNQNVVWELLMDNNSLNPIEQKVMDEVLALAQEYNGINTEDETIPDPLDPQAAIPNPNYNLTLDGFLANKGINDINVYLEDKLFIESNGATNNEFTATAIMANPLVPGVTDGEQAVSIAEAGPVILDPVGPKTVFWYILAGSYNVSFSKSDLVTEAASDMFDYTDDSSDMDNDGNTDSDTYGMAAIPYFFYWWGSGFPEFEEMSVNIGAVVDIDKDSMIDLEKGSQLDSFKDGFKVVKTIQNPGYDPNSATPAGPYNSPSMVEKILDPVTGEPIIDPLTKVPFVETFTPENIDIDYYNAGKMLVAKRYGPFDGLSTYKDVWIDGYYTGKIEHPGYTETKQIWHDGYTEQKDIWHEGYWETKQIWHDGYNEHKHIWHDGYWETKQIWHDGYWSHGHYHSGYWETKQVWHDGYTEQKDIWHDGYWETKQIWHDGYNEHKHIWHEGYWETKQVWHEAWTEYTGWVSGHYVNGAPSVIIPAGYYGDCRPVYKDECTINPEPYYQRFVIESYNEPFAAAEKTYSRWLDLTVTKTESKKPDVFVEGATYELSYDSGRTSPNSYPYETVFTGTTGPDGKANFTNLPWGVYELKETIAPAGYKLDAVTHIVKIGGDLLFNPIPAPYGYIDVTNDPIPPSVTTTTVITTGDTGITVAGLTEGIQVLAFTGIDPLIPISGGSAIAGGLGLFIVSLLKRNRKK